MTPVDILKYFYEEPAALEVLTPDLDPDARQRDMPAKSLEAFLAQPRYYRGYLAGTDLATGRIGATALSSPDVFVHPLLDALGEERWTAVEGTGAMRTITKDRAATLLRAPGGTAALVAGEVRVSSETAIILAANERRQALQALRPLLDAGAVVLFPEPAHDGVDWSLFAARPLREAFAAALARHPSETARRFVLPYRRARGEHRFYFEQVDLAPYAAYEV